MMLRDEPHFCPSICIRFDEVSSFVNTCVGIDSFCYSSCRPEPRPSRTSLLEEVSDQITLPALSLIQHAQPWQYANHGKAYCQSVFSCIGICNAPNCLQRSNRVLLRACY